MKKLYRREQYLKKIRGFYDESEIIKVITGVRRCGKSSLLDTIMEELLERGIPDKNIIDIHLDKRPYKNIKKPADLEKIIDESSAGVDGLKYLFVDEIANVKGFEEVINAFREEGDFLSSLLEATVICFPANWQQSLQEDTLSLK